MKFFLWVIALGIIFRMISNFLRPIFNITATNNRMRQMQEQMQEMNNKMNETAKAPKARKEGDYIDYEELK